ncbi:Adenosine 5'-monophosphoramidase HINT3 [Caenorhabditis elegans]|nr:HIT domain-containing protein [Caenorhabditis elegans]CCD65772.1 HIT domain-containing protein [Caenorhabditis elegans]|eukprot:NP_001256090.1 HIstidiNe Triad nucleotide-binding protein [Caenorhabditis elegans]
MTSMHTSVNGCKFCDIVKNKKELQLKENKSCVVINDIKPKAKNHYLVLSKQHIAKPTDLTVADVPLLEEMEKTGRELLREHLKKKGEADTVEDMLRIGFHLPPLLSVHHLHMHIIYPISDMGLISRKLTFRPGKVFKPARELIDQLKEDAGVPDPLEGNPAKDDVHEKIPAQVIS